MPQPSRLLRRGCSGTDVADWQRQLAKLGHPVDANGYYGIRTELATKDYQRLHGLVADGIVGPKTRAAARLVEAEPPPTQRTSREVAKVATPLTEYQLVDVLSVGHERAFGTLPSTPRLACAWAQVCLEHGRGRYVYCNNIGNITALGGWTGPFYRIRVQERIRRDPDEWKWFDLKFRAWNAPEDGAADYWKLLSGRYASALARFDAGDPWGAALELSRLGFYTARAEHYARAMASLYRDFPG